LTGKREKLDDLNEEDIYDPEKRIKSDNNGADLDQEDEAYNKQQLVEWMKAIANNDDEDEANKTKKEIW
jgi:hypothetical protein